MNRHVKLETSDEAMAGVLPRSWGSSKDLNSGYWQIGLNKNFRKYVGVHFVHLDSSVTYFVYNTLFLGECDAVFIFTKMLKAHKKYLTKMGISLCLYIDDERVVAATEQLCWLHTQVALDTLRRAGWIVKPSKCTPPTQTLRFLGLINDFVNLHCLVAGRHQSFSCTAVSSDIF